MNGTPTRRDRQGQAGSALPREQGVRVLASLGNRQGLRALLAFSGLHENIREGRPAAATVSDKSLLETERFVLDEVLQLVCVRVQAVTHADSILIALAEGGEFVCRAAAGSRAIPQGMRLNRESKFLREGLASGKIIRCEDCGTDARVQLDVARQLEALSTVLVPLRGRNEPLGVLQAFSAAAWSFTDHDIRCFDLFAELVLAALKPADQDRRLNWLGDVAGKVLQTKPDATVSATAKQADVKRTDGKPGTAEPRVAAPVERTQPAALVPTPAASKSVEPQIAAQPPAAARPSVPDLGALTDPIVIPVEIFDPDPEPPVAEPSTAEPSPAQTSNAQPSTAEPATSLSIEAKQANIVESPATAALEQPEFKTPFLSRILLPLGSQPGLSVALILVLVVGLFSAGAWWGMQAHENDALGKMALAPKSITTPPAPEVLAPIVVGNPTVSDSASDDAPLTPASEAKLASLPKVTGVRHWSSSMGSTVVIDMEDQVNYEVHRLMSPERIYFDLRDTALPADLDGKTMDIGDASLRSLRVAQPIAGVTRIVLDTKNGSNFSVSMEANPYRLVVELRGAKSLASNRPAPSAPSKPATAAPLTATVTPPTPPVPARTGKFRIVLDAGHGGWDMGTVGRQGLLEKNLVLDVTKRLGKLLQSRNGAEVLFTRTGDDYIPLDQRADFANQAQADLFVSIHANYSNSTAARGVETYYTNLFSAPGLKEIEKHADGTPMPAPVTLSADGLREKTGESRRLAASVQRSLYATLAAKSPDIRDRGIKDASFVVLTGTTMPAILTEISFVSSPADEQNLLSDAYRQQIAEALYKGIARYEGSSPKTRVAQLRPVSAGR